jgi:hypothetical protein
MKHPDARCDCGSAAASPLALRWRCPVCGKTAIMKVSTLAADCDGDTIRKVEPEVVGGQQSTIGDGHRRARCEARSAATRSLDPLAGAQN